MLPAGYTRLLVPAYDAQPARRRCRSSAIRSPCVVDDELYVAAMKTDESEDWQPRSFGRANSKRSSSGACARIAGNQVLAQVALCSREYGCFTAQNVFLERGEAALPVSPKCNARCIGCISEQDPDAGLPSPQTRISYETKADELARIAIHHLERVPDGIVSFGQGCEGEPLLRSIEIAAAIERIRAARVRTARSISTPTAACPAALERCIDAGLQAVRISLNSFRPHVYAAYYRPLGYTLDDVLESIRLACSAGCA